MSYELPERRTPAMRKTKNYRHQELVLLRYHSSFNHEMIQLRAIRDDRAMSAKCEILMEIIGPKSYDLN